MRYGIFVFLFIVGASCSKTSDQLFWVSTDDHDLLYMAESTNVAVLQQDSLQQYLTDRELAMVDSTTTYKNFGKIFETKKFRIFVLLRSSKATGRDYRFLLRTYRLDGNLIDSFQLATFSETLDEYCTGSINRNLAITRKCKNHESVHKMVINDEGRILVNAPSNAQ